MDIPLDGSTKIQAHPPRVAFISGPIDMPEGYFQKYYEPLLDRAIEAEDDFVVGPAPGVDALALQYLLDKGVHPSRITVYLAEFQGKFDNSRKWFERLGGNVLIEGLTTRMRDAAMTRDSNYDILRYMSVKEQMEFFGARYYPRISNTEMNERRRNGLSI